MLEESGYSVWFQDWDFRGNFVEHMQRAHQKADRTLVVLSDHYLGSDFALSEWSARFAEDPAARDDRLVPIKVGPVADGGILRPLVYADLTGCDEAEAQRRLLERIKRAIDASYRSKPQDRPGFPGAPSRVVLSKPQFPTGHPAYPEIFESVPPRDLNFTGREDILSQLHCLLMDPNRPAAITQAAIHGLGGVGKTSVAAEYAHRHASEYAGVWWAPAENQTVLLASLAVLAGQLDPRFEEETDHKKAAQRGLASLARSAVPFLLVYDNVEAPDVLHGLVPSAGARVLLTTRWTDWGGQAAELELDVLGSEAAVAFLQKRAGRADAPGAMGLAEALGYLPLALDHAGAYCRLSGLSFDAYRNGIDTRITKAPKGVAYPASVAATFGLAIEKAAAEQPTAETLLSLCAYIAPERIPLDLIATEITDENKRTEALMILAAVSLIDHEELDSGQPAVMLHRLVQAAMRTRLAERGETATTIELVARMLTVAFPRTGGEDISQWSRCAVLIPHVLELLKYIDASQNTSELYKLFHAAASYLQWRGSYSQAEQLYRRAISISENVFGVDHPQVAAIRNDLGTSYWQAGRFAEAELLLKEALATKEKVYGHNHNEVASGLNNLANIYFERGRLEEAEALYKEAIAIGEATIGRRHHHVATRLNSLALIYASTNRPVEAEALYIEAIEIGESTLGPEHPEVAKWLNNLAHLYSSLQRYREAEPLFERAIEIGERTLGRRHLEVATWICNLGLLYASTDRLGEAEMLFKESIGVAEDTVGRQHPRVADWLRSLADLYHATGRNAAAEPLYKEAIAIDKDTFGRQDVRVLNQMIKLAHFYGLGGQNADAEPLLRDLLQTLESTVGRADSKVRSTATKLAKVLEALGRHSEAAALRKDYGIS